MVDTVITPTNDFIKAHVTDELHKQIVSELSTRKEKTKGSRKIKLTSEMLRQFLFFASMGLSLEKSANKCGLGENTRKDYALKSTTFSEVSSLAKDDPDDIAIMGMVEAMRGTKPYYFPLKNEETGAIKYIEMGGKEPNVQIMQWWAIQKNLVGEAKTDDTAPQLGAPRNKEEADLLLMLLNKHNDYVEAKRKSTK